MNKKKTLLIVALILCIIMSFFIGKTFAKYTSKVEGSGIAEVAKWSFKVNSSESQIQTINLMETYDDKTLTNGKIAPGTQGQFELILDSTDSEVGVNYSIKFEDEQNKPNNLKFIYNNNEYSTLKEMETVLTGTIDANATNKVKSVIIQWQWPYETGDNSQEISSNDNLDTEDGSLSQDYKFNVIVSGTQVIPEQV